MDLKLMAAQATTAEKAAVDTVLGPPAGGWQGGERTQADMRVARGGAAARAERHRLLPALWALQDQIGWISAGGMNYVCERLTVPPAEAYGVATFYAMFSTTPQPERVAHVCDDVVCRTNGANAVIDQLSATGATVVRSPCLGRCSEAPAALYQLAGDQDWTQGAVTPAQVSSAIDAVDAASGNPIAAPQTGDPNLRLLARVGVVDPASLDSYRRAGGYLALDKAVELGPDGVISEVETSGLLGRGGAAFPTGFKWRAVADEADTPHYFICNADESEPGTFKDRILMERDPFALVEALTIGGFATGSEKGFIYIRGEYPEAARVLDNAIDEARSAGLLGDDVGGHSFVFDIEVRRGAGAYICGEETALMESIEGYRGEPRQKPPFPTQSGLFGKPTAINNVETLFNVLEIVNGGGGSFAAIGDGTSTGTRLFCLSGAVERPGVYEVELGTTLRSLLELAGVADFQALLLGGAAGTFITPEQIDLPLTFDAARQAGVTLGSGAVVVFGPDADMADVVCRIAAFFRDESCGQCVPCRVGTVRQEEALARLNGSSADRQLIEDIAQTMADASICGLGHTAASAVRSAIDLGLVG